MVHANIDDNKRQSYEFFTDWCCLYWYVWTTLTNGDVAVRFQIEKCQAW